MSLPYDVIRIIRSFVPWSTRCRMISKRWVHEVLHRRIKLYSWSFKKRVYSYMITFGERFCNRSWSNMAKTFKIKRQARNSHFRLTWRAAVVRFMHNHCRGCGQKTHANVFGLRICLRCQRNPYLKYSYMVTTGHAKRMGVPKATLDQIPYHLVNQSRLRFRYLLGLSWGASKEEQHKK